MLFIEKYKFSKISKTYVSRVEVENFYSNYKDSISMIPELFDFSVIEIPFLAGNLSETIAYNFLDSLRSLVLSGQASFDDLAKEHSEDPGSSSLGGSLGFTSRGSLVNEYEEEAYSLMPGELSSPIRTKFGYHLIRLIDRLGEKISTQHILIFVPFSSKDKDVSLKKALLLRTNLSNDPFVFDSIATAYANNYKNFSGTYLKSSTNEIPLLILKNIKNLDPYNISAPLETEGGYLIIYLYKHVESYFPDLENSWTLLYNYALQQKQNIVFDNILEKIKKHTYIKII
jgi:peptidyl-prolyl cis-trans isomerase SurA